MRFREHRGALADSLETTRDIPATIGALALEASLALGRYVEPRQVHVEFYGYDMRCNWDMHIVKVDGYGVFGFTDQQV